MRIIHLVLCILISFFWAEGSSRCPAAGVKRSSLNKISYEREEIDSFAVDRQWSRPNSAIAIGLLMFYYYAIVRVTIDQASIDSRARCASHSWMVIVHCCWLADVRRNYRLYKLLTVTFCFSFHYFRLSSRMSICRHLTIIVCCQHHKSTPRRLLLVKLLH